MPYGPCLYGLCFRGGSQRPRFCVIVTPPIGRTHNEQVWTASRFFSTWMPWPSELRRPSLAWWFWTTLRFTPPGWSESVRRRGRRGGLCCTGCQPTLPAPEPDRGGVAQAQRLSDAETLLRFRGRVEAGRSACPSSTASRGGSMFTWRYLVLFR